MNRIVAAGSVSTPQAWPVTGEFLPDFELPSSEGKLVRNSDYLHRRSLVLVFAGEHGANIPHALLSDLARHYAQITEEDAEVLVVLRGTLGEALRFKQEHNLPYPVLADEDGQVHRKYGNTTPDDRSSSEAVYVAGLFGRVYLSCRAGDGPPLPTAQDILGSLRFIESRCPECGQEEF